MGPLRQETIYAAILDDEAFLALPAWLARAAGARTAMLQWRHRDGTDEVLAYSGLTPADAAAYLRRQAADDPWTAELLSAAVVGETAASSAAQETWPVVSGTTTRAVTRTASRLEVGVAFDFTGGCGILRLGRGPHGAPFASADLDGLEEPLPHLRRLFMARGEVAARARARRVRGDDLDKVGLGSVALRADGGIASANRLADRVLCRGDGLRLSRGLVACARASDKSAFDSALAKATAMDGGGATVIEVSRNGSALPYLVSVIPHWTADGSADALLVFRDPDTLE